MNLDEMLDNEVFYNIEPERIDAVKKIVEEVRGKSVPEVMMVLMKHSKTLNAGRKITKEERDAMVEIIYKNLSEEEQDQFKSIIKVIENFT
jgi:hypothetical protein